MNAPFVIAQVTPTPGANPPRVIKLTKPQGDQAVVVYLSYDGTVKVDFSDIANEKITLVRVGERVVILFLDSKATITLDPFFDLLGRPLADVTYDVGPGRDVLTGDQFAAIFPIITDQSILPAGGEQQPQNTGGEFDGPSIDPLLVGPPLPLLPPEELPNFKVVLEVAPVNTDQGDPSAENSFPTINGNELFLDDEGQFEGIANAIGALGDVPDERTGFPVPDQFLTFDFGADGPGDIVFEPLTFVVQDASGNPVALQARVFDATANGGTGAWVTVNVDVAFPDEQTVAGTWTDSAAGVHNAFLLQITDTTTGAYTFQAFVAFVHPFNDPALTNTPGSEFEDNLFFQIDFKVTDSDLEEDTATLRIGVNDDSPDGDPSSIAGFHEETNDGVVFIDTLDDENQLPHIAAGSPGIIGGPGDDGSGTQAFGALNVVYGADGPSSSVNPLELAASVTVTNSLGADNGPLQVVWVDADGNGVPEPVTLQWVADPSGVGGILYGLSDHFPDTADPVFTLQIHDAAGNYTFTLNGPLAHPFTDDDFQNNGTDTEFEDNLTLAFNYTATDGDGDQTLGTITVKVDDDTPDPLCDTATVTEGGQGSVNLVLIIDVSLSMQENPDGPGGFATRLDLAKAAAINLINAGNTNEVFVAQFSTGAASSGWVSPADAITYINGLTLDAFTNYDAALDEVMGNWGAGPTSASQTLAYFLSDGEPNRPIGDAGIDATEEQDWIDFLSANGVDQTFAIGVGAGLSSNGDEELEPIAWTPGEQVADFTDGTDPNVIVITSANEADLVNTLINLLPGAVTGNVLANDAFGADGLGGIVSIVVDGFTYVYNPTTGAIAIPLGATGTDAGGGTLEVDTAFGGHLSFHFADALGHPAGDWQYLSPAVDNVPPEGELETFSYFIVDGDGDGHTAQLKITVLDNPVPNAEPTAATVDDEGLASGILGDGASFGDVDLPDPEHIATGVLAHSYNGDNPAGIDPISFDAMDGIGSVLGTEAITYDWDGTTNTLTASSVGRGAIFTVVVDGGVDNGDGNFVVTLLQPVLHASGDGENDAGVNLLFRVTDDDGAISSSTLNVTFDDDTPTLTVESICADESPTSVPLQIAEVEDNNSLATAQLISLSQFTVGANPDVGDASLPWASISGQISPINANDVDLYKIHLEAGETITLDIDYGYGAGTNVDTVVELFDSAGNFLNVNDDGGAGPGGGGSVNGLDSYLTYTAAASGDYYIGVSAYSNFASSGPTYENDASPSYAGGDYVLNISLDTDRPVGGDCDPILVHDETEGVQTLADPNAQNDVLGSALPGTILALFNAISDKGVDPDVGVLDNDAIGFARSGAGNSGIIITPNYGADGPGANPVYALTIPGANGAVDSGVDTTDGHDIYLFLQPDGLLVGRVDLDDSGTADADDPAAFAVAIDPVSGEVFSAQYLSLSQPLFPSTFDEPVLLADNAVQVVVTITDGDGDTVSSNAVGIGHLIGFQDDGPTVDVTAGQGLKGPFRLDETIDPDGDGIHTEGDDNYGPGDLVHDNAGDFDDTDFTIADPLGVNPFGTWNLGPASGLFTVTESAGADGEQSDVRTLSLQLFAAGGGAPVAVGVGVLTNLEATQPAAGGNPDSDTGDAIPFTPYANPDIYLFLEGDGSITGRVGDDAGGPIAFRLSLSSSDPTANIKLDQFLAIDHPTTPDTFDENVILGIPADTSNLAGIAVSLSVTITDGDGDSVTDDYSANITNLITFDDDGPNAVADSDSVSAAPIQIVTFDDIPLGDGAEQAMPSGYAGFTWAQAGVYNPGLPGYAPHSDPNLAFIGEANGSEIPGPDYPGVAGSPLIISRAEDFTPTGAWFSATFTDGLPITFEGFDDGVSQGSFTVFVDQGGPTFIDFTSFAGFASIDELRIDTPDLFNGFGGYFGLDDFGYRDEAPIATGNVVTGADGGLGSDVNTSPLDGSPDDAGTDGFGSIAWTNAVAQGGGLFTVAGLYGTLTVDAFGNYSYDLNEENPAVIGLSDIDPALTETFSYTLTDGDGDTDDTTLTINVTGADDGVIVFNLTPAINGGDAVVDEDDLSDGSSPSAPNLTQTGTFNFSAPDGVDDLFVGGAQVITDGVVTLPAPIPTTYGLLTITGVNLSTGEVDYSYTLTDNTFAHGPADNGQNSVFDAIPVSLTDTDGDAAASTLAIRVIDDVPVITPGTTGLGDLTVDESVGFDAGDPNADDEATVDLPSVLDTYASDHSLTVIGAATENTAISGDVLLFGADGPAATGSVTRSFHLVTTVNFEIENGAPSGLSLTNGTPIFLFHDGDLIVGRAGTDAVDAALNPAAFAIYNDPATGSLSMAQYQALHHGNPADADESATPASLSLNVLETIVITDGDGDTDHANRAETITFNFQDDGPDVDFAGATTVNENGAPINGTYAFVPGVDGVLSGSLTVNVNGLGIQTFTPAQLADGESIVTTAGTLALSTPAVGTWTFTPTSVSATSNVNISITITDGDGDVDTDTHTIQVVNVNQPLNIDGAVSGVVEEEHGLPGGIEDIDDLNGLDTDETPITLLNTVTNIATGSFASFIFGGVDGTLSFAFSPLGGNPPVQTVSDGALTSGDDPVLFHQLNATTLIGYVNSNGSGVDPFGAGDTTIFTLTLTPATGAYTFTLNAPVDHPINSVEDIIAIDLNGRVTVTDSGGPAGDTNVPLNASITVIDDIPAAQTDTAEVTEGTQPTLNVILVIDLSSSMDDASGVPGLTRLELLQQAVTNYLNSPDVDFNQIVIYTFNNGATFQGVFNTVAAAIAEVNSYDSGDLFPATEYDSTAADVQNDFEDNRAPLGAADQTQLLFLSDGDPTGGSSLDPGTEQTNWLNFLNNNGIDEVIAVGFGGIVDTSFLDPMAPRAQDDAIAVINAGQLEAVLEGTLPGQISGNVLLGEDNVVGGGDDDGFGADGGRILSIQVGAVVYTYNPSTLDITASSGPNPTADTPILSVDTPGQGGNEGHLTFNFLTGAWDYTAPNNVISDQIETFPYVLIDGDGDTHGANLEVTVLNVPEPPQLALDSTQNVRDEFGTAAYTNNDGSKNWGGNWTETGDDNGPGGEITITGGRLDFTSSVDGGEIISRAVDLSSASSATLTFTWELDDTDSGDDIIVEAFNGLTWDTLGTLDGSLAEDTVFNFSAALTAAQIGAHTAIRLRDVANLDSGENIFIDNVNIAFTATTGGHTATFTEGGSAVGIATLDSLITDGDSPNMATGSIVLANEQPGDQFLINGVAVSNGSAGTFSGVNYTVTDNGATITIAMTSSATQANYQTFIEAVTFRNTSDAPAIVARTVNVIVNDGDSNSNTATATIAVVAVNDPPVQTGDHTATVAEGGTYAIAASDLGFTDPDDNAAGVTFTASSLVNGIVQVNGVTQNTFTGTQLAANQVTFVHNGTETLTASFQVNVEDGNEDSSAPVNQAFNFTVTPVNDAPVLANVAVPNLAAINEDVPAPSGVVGTLVSSLVDLTGGGGINNVTDPDSGALLGIALTATNNTNGTWWYTTNNGGVWTAVGAVSTAQALLLAADANSRLYFQPSANFNGTVTSAITFKAWDQTSGLIGTKVDATTSGGTTPFSTATDTADIVVNPINDEPSFVLLDNTLDVNEDPGAQTVVSFASSISAGPANESGQTLTFTAFNNTNPGLFAVAPAVAANGTLTYTLAANASGTATIDLRLTDNGGTASGGDDTSPTQQFTITVAPVNDPPTSGNDSVATNEDTTVVLALTDFGTYADVEGTPIASVRITTLESNGSLEFDTTGLGAWTAVTLNQDITAANITAGRLRFVPDANENGTPYTTVGFRVSDGAALSTAAYTLTVNVNPINDAPSGANTNIGIVEDTPHTFSASDFGFSDPLDGNTLSGVRITTLPANGVLELSGVPVTANQTISSGQIGNLVFIPYPNESGAGYASFTFAVIDNGGSASGGVDTDPTPNTITFNVTAANDAPAIYSPSNLQYDPAADDQTPFNRIMFADADSAGSVTVTLTRTAGDGTLSASSGGGVTVGGSSTALTLVGTIVAINAFLAANGVTLDSQGNDDDTYSIAINDGTTTTTKTGFTVSDIAFDDDTVSGNENSTNVLAGVNVYEVAYNGLNDNDTMYTSWIHVGASATSYDGDEGGTNSDTIFLIFTPGQLQEILLDTTFRNELQPYLSSTNGDTLSLGTSSWRATATDFETANIELANIFSTRDTVTPANNYIDINTTWKSVISSAEIVGMTGGAGNDLVIANAAGTVTGLGGNDVLVGTNAGNTLDGGALADLLLGGTGADTLIGGTGNDVLAGGAGADIFKFAAGDIGTANRDIIVDYNFAEGDKIDLSGLLDSVFTPGANNVNDFVQLTVSGNDLIVQVDTAGTGTFGGGTHDVATLVGMASASAGDVVRLAFEASDHLLTV